MLGWEEGQTGEEKSRTVDVWIEHRTGVWLYARDHYRMDHYMRDHHLLWPDLGPPTPNSYVDILTPQYLGM